MRTHPVDKLLEQHCYKSAAGLLQLVRFYVCIVVYHLGWACIWSLVILTKISWGGKNRRALLTGNVIKQLQEIRLNEDLLLKILRKP